MKPTIIYGHSQEEHKMIFTKVSIRKGPKEQHLYLHKIESLNLGGGVFIVRKCEALHITYQQIQCGKESDMGKLEHQLSHYRAKFPVQNQLHSFGSY